MGTDTGTALVKVVPSLDTVTSTDADGNTVGKTSEIPTGNVVSADTGTTLLKAVGSLDTVAGIDGDDNPVGKT